jgi:glycosyltransferase involved in cell wall biosynthesis
MGLIEALAYGLPCMATTGTNMRPEIEQYNAGWTADNTVESIAAALEKMLKERDKLMQKSKNARALAEQYNWDKIAQQSHQIYEEIIARHS